MNARDFLHWFNGFSLAVGMNKRPTLEQWQFIYEAMCSALGDESSVHVYLGANKQKPDLEDYGVCKASIHEPSSD